MSKIVVVNAGPRKGWNTDTLISEAAKGAEAKGAEIVRFDLYTLDKFKGCVSCFGCKKEKSKSHCVCNDALTPVLDAIRESDGLILGSPIYLGDFTASFRALYERLCFQYLTYNKENPCSNEHMIPVLVIMTCNAQDTNYTSLMQGYKGTLTRLVGPAEVLTAGDTMQLEDYSKTDWPWTNFDPAAKKQRHETVFQDQKKQAYEMGSDLVK